MTPRAKVTVYVALPRPADDPNLALVTQRSIGVIAAQDDTNFEQLAALATACDVVVDALLGTGIARPIEGVIQRILQTVAKAATQRESPPVVVAVDMPSGLNADTGEVDPVTLPASLTVTFAFPKRGHFLYPGAHYVGELVTADIGISPALVRNASVELAELGFVASLLPRRPSDANKGSFGKVLAVAGCANYTGAAHLATMAAYRAGAGLVTLAHAATLHAALAAKSSEVTFQPLPEADPGYIGADALPLLLEAAPRYESILIGCGLGAHAQTRALVPQLVAQLKSIPQRRMVIDADGLNALSADAQWPAKLTAGTVLTPHPGEMSRLCGLTIEQIQADRIGVAMRFAKAWEAVIVLKGAYSVIAAPDGVAVINPFANPALATAGTGDVLAGIIAGLLAQGLAPFAAAICGAFVHALAGEIVSKGTGESGLVASDLLPAIPLAMHTIRHPQQASQAG